MRATNKWKVTHGKTPCIFYIFSGSSWSYVKDLYSANSMFYPIQMSPGQESLCIAFAL